MLTYFNKAGKVISNYFKHDEKIGEKGAANIDDCLIYLNSQVILWKEDENFDDENFNQLFSFRFNSKYKIYNLSNRKLQFKNDMDKIVDFKAPDYPSYTLEFLLNFAVSAKIWLDLDTFNVLLVHDNLENPKVLALVCTVLSYLNKNIIHPMDLYANIISTNKSFASLANIEVYKNVTRYINYFSMVQINPIFNYKKLYLKTVIINGAPAIDNLENNRSKNSHYLTINKRSYYKPVLRIISNDKVCYCSYKKNIPTEKVFFSADNCAKFDSSCQIFGDTILEILHHTEQDNKFKQLFLLQFNSFFIDENGIRFTKDQIDGICKDIRYPNEFYIDLLFDESKASNVSVYEEDVSKWKNVISNFIMKSYRNNNNLSIDEIENSKKNDTEQTNLETSSGTILISNSIRSTEQISEIEKEEDITLKPNTLNKAQEILQKYKDKNITNKDEDEEEDEEDFENYLQNLENKNKK